jgi:dipeptidyl aminopeptidase/acylaminoacyl peptidase
MVAALGATGVRADHHLFDGERHGFRQAATLVAVARLEIAFYRDVLHLATPEQAP